VREKKPADTRSVQRDAVISIEVSASDRLFLTKFEADRLAETMRQELVCRTAAQADDLVEVADISLTVAEAWRLFDRLESATVEEIDWQRNGF
jgi:hypothetical protein